MKNDVLTILNYPGSKKRLLPFIDETIESLLEPGKVVLDVFSGTSAVGYSLKKNYSIIANDAEIYCQTIGEALLSNNKFNFDSIREAFFDYYNDNIKKLEEVYQEVFIEDKLLITEDSNSLVNMYENFKNIWQEGYEERSAKPRYSLFTTYYSNNYFGIRQSMQIDSIRYSIEKIGQNSAFLLSSLYFAMKEAVFSKDGHMAQPLNIYNRQKVLLKRRKVSIIDSFIKKINEFSSEDFIISDYANFSCNYTLNQVLENGLIDKCDLVYADPPYTDMQYSRYFHLLETVTKYDFPKISMYRGKISTGIYRDDRFQSPLSQRGKAKKDIELLVKMCSEHKKKLVFSYAYPVDLDNEKSDRYTMSIDDLIFIIKKYYGEDKTKVLSENFLHSNNRNREAKKVFEYLIVGDVYE